MFQRRGLGKGLESLIPQKYTGVSPTQNQSDHFVPKEEGNHVESAAGRFIFVDPHLISANPYQPRTKFEEVKLKELGESIQAHGIIHPLIVIGKEEGGYELISGERRLRAALSLGLSVVPVFVRVAQPQEQFEISVIENLQREDLNPIELGRAYQKFLDLFALKQEELSRRLGISRSKIANTIRFLGLQDPIQESLATGEITEGHAKIILSLETIQDQMNLWKKITMNKMTVRGAEREAGYLKRSKKGFALSRDPNLAAIERLLEDKFNTKVTVEGSLARGRIIVKYFSQEELEAIAGTSKSLDVLLAV